MVAYQRGKGVAVAGDASSELSMRSAAVSLHLLDNALRDIRIWGHLVLDALYVAVRDEAWRTVPAVVRQVSLSRRASGFTALLHGVHGGADPVFTWDGEVVVEAATMRFSMSGVVLRDFTSQRVGICLLHPLELVGREFEASTAAGVQIGRFSESINPGSPVSGFTELRYDAGCPIRIGTEGVPYEMEDHRNWTDAGWKSYSPPLDQSGVRRLRVGDRIDQAVTITGPDRAPRTATGPVMTEAVVTEAVVTEPVVIEAAGPIVGAVPAIGCYPCAGVEDLPFGCVHVDLCEGDGWERRLRQAADLARAAQAPLSVSLVRDSAGWLAEAVSAVAAAGPVVRVSVFELAPGTTAAGDAARVRALLRRLGCRAPVGGGSRLHFAELNRLQEPRDDWEFSTFPITPQGHHTDAASIMATVRAQPFLVERARRVAAGRPVVVGPLAFRARTAGTAAADPTDPVDPREDGQLCATWLLASILALRDAEAVTVLLGAGRAAPAWRLLRELLALRGHPIREVATDPRRLVASIVDSPGRGPTALVANLGPDPVSVVFHGSETSIAGYGAAVLRGAVVLRAETRR